MGEIPSHSQAILHRFALRRLFNFLSLSLSILIFFIYLADVVAVVDRTAQLAKEESTAERAFKEIY